jgi:hypothetical protein
MKPFVSGRCKTCKELIWDCVCGLNDGDFDSWEDEDERY